MRSVIGQRKVLCGGSSRFAIGTSCTLSARTTSARSRARNNAPAVLIVGGGARHLNGDGEDIRLRRIGAMRSKTDYIGFVSVASASFFNT